MTVVAPPATVDSFLDRLDSLSELRPFPTVASRLMTACQDPNTTSKSIADIIQCDAGLALRLLRLANSPLYGFANAIRTVDHAVVVLGFRSVRDLALSMTGADMFSQGSTAAEERAALWRHCLGCATVARLLTEYVPDVSPNEAFLGGIFHDVGKLIFYDLVPDEYVEVAAASTSISLAERERQTFGLSHEQVGMRCSEEWRLPATIANAIGYHHAPQSAPQDQHFVSLIHAANRLAKSWQIGSTEQPNEDAMEALADAPLALDATAIETVFARAAAEFDMMVQACLVE